MVSGLHCTWPNGTSAPGKVFPPPEVQVRVSTIAAGSVTGLVTVAWFLAPRGSAETGSLAGQLLRCPDEVMVQCAVRRLRGLRRLAALGRCPVLGAAVAAEPGRGVADAGTAAVNVRAAMDAMPSAMDADRRQTRCGVSLPLISPSSVSGVQHPPALLARR